MVSPAKPRILVVDDEPPILGVMSHALQLAGYDAVCALLPSEALKISPPLDLVISDVVMPEMHGPELVRELRHRFPNAAAILMSGFSEEDLSLGSDVIYLQKPFSLPLLFRTVAAALSASACSAVLKDPRSREELEDLWRTRTGDARRRYERAAAEFKSVLAAVPSGTASTSPDGAFAIRKAQRIETSALREYHRILRIFTDLTVNGVLPPGE